MIKTTAMLIDELREYVSPADKISRMVKNGKIVPIRRGLYSTEKAINPYVFANMIYGPSYVSFEYALSVYGLIPETVRVVTSATFEKKKKKQFKTEVGTFTYRDIPAAVYPLGLELRSEGEYFYMIASREKALCDQLYKVSPVSNYSELEQLLFEDLRVDENELMKFSLNDVEEYAKRYGSTNVRRLAGYMRKRMR